METRALQPLLITALILLYNVSIQAQVVNRKHTPSRADSLIGGQHDERTAYDITYYHLDIRVDPEQQHIAGQNLFRFKATRNFTRLQFDLFENMRIEEVLYKGRPLPYTREFKAVFIEFPEVIQKGSEDEFIVKYEGKPQVAENAPWDGGFVYSTDKRGEPWIGVAVQGVGASLWWPNKDQQADEVDSMRISVAVPDGLMNVSNGRFEGKEDAGNGYTRFNWFVSYPINNYNVTLNIADYAHIKTQYQGLKGELPLDYFVLKENEQKAKKHFANNVPRMLTCFEHWFGPYPFYQDGYKLIESAYLGMEHQSAVAYGNRYMNGYMGKDLSGTGHGDYWDFIIIHESGHEWFGNNITAKDIGDSWIHEGFTTYSEAVYVECQEGKVAANAYIKGLRKNIQNQIPLVAPYGVNSSTPGDIYYKGANILQTVRTVINNDKKWREILVGMNQKFGLHTVNTAQVIDYLNQQSGLNFTPILKEYLYFGDLPTLLVKKSDGQTLVKWRAHTSEFDLPIRIRTNASQEWVFRNPSTKGWTPISKSSEDVQIDQDWMYFDLKFLESTNLD